MTTRYAISKYSMQITTDKARQLFRGCDDDRKCRMIGDLLMDNYDRDLGEYDTADEARKAYESIHTVKLLKGYACNFLKFTLTTIEENEHGDDGEFWASIGIDYPYGAVEDMVAQLNKILY